MNLLIAPPGGGKTNHLVARAREAAAGGKRVWWVGLPSQRSYVYRRLTEGGALLGAEFLSGQQVYYRLLAHAMKLRPLLVGTGRLALVGEALLQLRGELPAPGEARLFAQAIAEAKRYGLGYRELDGDEEVRRFREVFRVYEALKGDRWDYDDFRSEALRHAEAGGGPGEAELIVVDGLREIGPLELRLYRALARWAEVWLALPEAPAGCAPTLTLPPRPAGAVERYRATNPVAEARWVLRALKRDLAAGIDPLELAVVLPEGRARAFAALSDEYGVPLMDETPRALADSLAGRVLLELLELPEYPTPSRLLAVPELVPLANAALAHGVAGPEAVGVLAEALGLGAAWRRWLGLLEVPEDALGWAETLLESVLFELHRDQDGELGYQQFKAHALQRAKEASSLASGASFRAWWAALLQETQLFERPRGGVALLSAKLASGRRFAKVYLMHAVKGAYTVGEGEDYFVPEEAREALEWVFARLAGGVPRGGRLPRRFLGRDRALHAELLARGARLVVTCPEADQDGPLAPEPGLVGAEMSALPPLPTLSAASRLELAASACYRAGLEPVELGEPRLEALRRHQECGFRYWAERRLPREEEAPWWLELLGELRRHRRLNKARLALLQERFPQAAPWLAEQAPRLLELQFDVPLPEDEAGPRARLDAVRRRGDEASLYRFTAPGRVQSEAEASDYLDGRWNELWAAGHLLSRYQGRLRGVWLLVWPLLGEPVAAYGGAVTYLWKRVVYRQQRAQAAYVPFGAGEVRPNPGYRCRGCRVADLCREAGR